MLVRDLVAHLEHVKRLYSAAEAKSQANDIAAIIDALAKHLDRSLEGYVAVISAAKPPSGGRQRRTPQRADQDAGLIQDYVSELKIAYSDRTRFASILERLKRDRGVNANALTAIVNSVTGHEGAFKNKGAAYDWLSTDFTDNLKFQRKLHPV